MKYAQRKLELLEKFAVLGGIFLIVFVAGYYSGYFKKNCGQDSECFSEHLKNCRSAEYIGTSHNNVYLYEAYPGVSNDCKLKITLQRVVVGAAPEFKNLEGKSMRCRLPKEQLETVKIDEMQDLIKNCSGELKEGLYEIIIQRMYSLVISQMSSIITEAEKALNNY